MSKVKCALGSVNIKLCKIIIRVEASMLRLKMSAKTFGVNGIKKGNPTFSAVLKTGCKD